MGHGRSDHGGGVFEGQLVRQLGQQGRQFGPIGRGVHHFAGAVPHPHASRPPVSGTGAQVVADHHEVHGPDQRQIDGSPVTRHLEGERHGVAVSGDGGPGVLGKVRNFPVLHDGGHVVQGSMVSLDADGTLNRSGHHGAAQWPVPALGNLQIPLQAFTQAFDLLQDAPINCRYRRYLIDHTIHDIGS